MKNMSNNKEISVDELCNSFYEESIDESNIPREHYEYEIKQLMIEFALYCKQTYKKDMMTNDKQSSVKDLTYWKTNAEENYMTTPISVLKYITELETHIETIKAQLPSNEDMVAKWMRDKIQGGNK
jgi:hypothetical protein